MAVATAIVNLIFTLAAYFWKRLDLVLHLPQKRIGSFEGFLLAFGTSQLAPINLNKQKMSRHQEVGSHLRSLSHTGEGKHIRVLSTAGLTVSNPQPRTKQCLAALN